jgi:hypothetical protein
MSKSPAYLWFAQDVLLSARVDSLTAEEECWYRRALDYAWIDGGLSCDPAAAASRIKKGCTPEAAKKLMGMFFEPCKKDVQKVVNEKQEILRKKLRDKIRKLSKAGKASAAKRNEDKGKQGKKDGNKCSTDDEQMSGNSIQSNSTKDKEEANASSSPTKKRATRLPSEFFLSAEMKAWAAEECPTVDLKTETKKFCNHYRSISGKNSVRLDWVLTWENWILGARDKYGASNESNQKHNSGAAKPTNEDRIADTYDVINQYPTESELGHFS